MSNHLPTHRFVRVQPRGSRFTLNSGLDLVVRLEKKALAMIARSLHQLEQQAQAQFKVALPLAASLDLALILPKALQCLHSRNLELHLCLQSLEKAARCLIQQ